MAKTIKTVCVLLVILLLSAAVATLAQHYIDKRNLAAYPREYAEHVEKYAAEYGVPEALCYAVIRTESAFNSAAVSSAGAVGLMQIMPSTFDYLCMKMRETHEAGMLYDPETNIRYGLFYLSMLYERFGVWETACAAYNAGPARVSGWLSDGYGDENGRLTEIPIEETERYVEKIRSAWDKYTALYYGGNE